MKKTALIVAAGLAALALGAGAVAQQTGKASSKPGSWAEPQTRADAEARVKAYFARVDANKDGMATRQEFAAAREAKQDERRDMAFDRIDADDNGSISRAEFDAAGKKMDDRKAQRRQRRGDMAARGEGRREGGKGERFARLDSDSNGSVSEAEMLRSAMARFDTNDADKDGSVTREERRAGMKARRGEN
jgi:Ca2+-binding EF-hand superfamily protein